MSKISLKPNASGTGVFSLEAPDSNTDRTLTLPDEAGSVLTDASDIEPQVKTATNATGSAPIYACRAWVNFDGYNIAIRNSGNVSSVTENSFGNYTFNFTTAMPDANYAFSGKTLRNIGTNDYGIDWQAKSTPSSSFLRVKVNRLNSGDVEDAEVVCVAIFR